MKRHLRLPTDRRASAFGLFTAGYGISWFLGSAAIGILYDVSLPATVAFCVLAELAAVPVFIRVGRRYRNDVHSESGAKAEPQSDLT